MSEPVRHLIQSEITHCEFMKLIKEFTDMLSSNNMSQKFYDCWSDSDLKQVEAFAGHLRTRLKYRGRE